MDQKLTEEQQRTAHKVIKANRGDCAYKGNYLNCWDCPNFFNSCDLPSPELQAENLRRSQAWLDEHITDAEILAESPREFCERMVRTEGMGKSIKCERTGKCILESKKYCSYAICFSRAKAYLASHPATSQEPPKRRPTPEEMVVGATVRVRLWDELVRDGKLSVYGNIQFPKAYFNKGMRKFCGTTHKIIECGYCSFLEGCDDWCFLPEMLDYVEPENVVEPKTKEELMNEAIIRDWDLTPKMFRDVHTAPKNSKDTAKEKSDATVKGDVDKLPLDLRLINFRDILPTDALRIIALEGQVDDLTKKLAASKKLCDRLQRRLRANWEAKRDGEMSTAEEIEAWFDAGNGSASLAGEKSKIIPKGHSSWIPATRGNLKL